MQVKINKVKQNNNKVKDVRAKNSPCRGLPLFPGNGARKKLAGAKLTWEYVVDVGAYSSLIPGNGARKKLLLVAW
jgi:hypothetical protein